jgi:hypothetical protein
MLRRHGIFQGFLARDLAADKLVKQTRETLADELKKQIFQTRQHGHARARNESDLD